jgi:orotate phosphoribosyltransferase
MSVYERDRARLIELLKTQAVREGDITLASGQKASVYVDCKQVALSGEGHFLIGRVFFHLTKEADGDKPYVACGGMSIGADPLSSSLSLTAYLGGRELPALYVRKEPKGHGTGAYLEGAAGVPTPARVVLVEDVVTTGGSSIKAIHRLREAGYEVDRCLALVDREAGGRENLEKEGVTLDALALLSELTK